MIEAISSGISVSITDSSTVNSGARIESFLYCPTRALKVFSMKNPPILSCVSVEGNSLHVLLYLSEQPQQLRHFFLGEAGPEQLLKLLHPLGDLVEQAH